MPVLDTRLDPHSEAFATNRSHMLRLLGEVRALEQRTRDRSAQSKPLFDKRGQLLPRDRIALLLDPASSFLASSCFPAPASSRALARSARSAWAGASAARRA